MLLCLAFQVDHGHELTENGKDIHARRPQRVLCLEFQVDRVHEVTGKAGTAHTFGDFEECYMPDVTAEPLWTDPGLKS